MAKVLVADDSILTRTMLKNIFLEMGHQVTEAIDGNDAVAKYFEVKPDLVLMDLVMPEKDGLSAIKDIINKDSGAKIVVCSADVQDFRVSEAIEAGASDYITKPFDKDKIKSVANKCLQSTALDEVRHDITSDRTILKDFIKNGILRGIQALSKMVDGNVKVSISDFRAIRPSEIPGYIGTQCIGVNYNLSGTNVGSSALLIPKQSALEVVGTLMGEDVSGHEDVVHSVFNEMGNVFINSFLSTFSDLIDTQITFDAPENVDQDTLAIKMESVVFSEPVSQAYIVKGSYFIDQMEFTMFLVIFTDIKIRGYKYDLKPGTNYMIIDANDEKRFEIFKYMNKRGFKGLCVTRKHPDEVRNLVGNDKMPVVWLTTEEVKIPNCVCTVNVPKIAKVIQSYYDKVNNVMLFIDNTEYLVETNSVGIIEGFFDELKANTIKNKNILMISIDPTFLESGSLTMKDLKKIDV
ncbi:MAG: response regulator [ANME-2 cluster archaeon]|nr:response regulator [ANME-2 cluster archaeon]